MSSHLKYWRINRFYGRKPREVDEHSIKIALENIIESKVRLSVDSFVLLWLQKSRKYTTKFLILLPPQIVGNGFFVVANFCNFVQKKNSEKSFQKKKKNLRCEICYSKMLPLRLLQNQKRKLFTYCMHIFIHVHENLDLIQMPQIILSRSLTLVYAKHNGAVVIGDFGVYRNQMYN